MIDLLEWESNFFGKKTARLRLGESLPDKAAIEQYCRKEHIALLQACADTSDNDTIFALETLGFHFVDLRLYMACAVTNNIEKNNHIRLSSENNIPQLLRIGHQSFTPVSRYNWRGFFTTTQIDAFYDTWLENGVRGKHDDFCLHYQIEDTIAGFTTIKVRGDSAYIGLIAVAPEFRGKGIGDALVQNVFAYAHEHKLATVSSATQGKNTATQNLYAKHGMQIKELQSWYYKETL